MKCSNDVGGKTGRWRGDSHSLLSQIAVNDQGKDERRNAALILWLRACGVPWTFRQDRVRGPASWPDGEGAALSWLCCARCSGLVAASLRSVLSNASWRLTWLSPGPSTLTSLRDDSIWHVNARPLDAAPAASSPVRDRTLLQALF